MEILGISFWYVYNLYIIGQKCIPFKKKIHLNDFKVSNFLSYIVFTLSKLFVNFKICLSYFCLIFFFSNFSAFFCFFIF